MTATLELFEESKTRNANKNAIEIAYTLIDDCSIIDKKDVDSLVETLEQLSKGEAAYQRAEALINSIKPYALKGLHNEELILFAYSKWVSALCDKANEQCDYTGHLKITIDSLEYKIRDFDIRTKEAEEFLGTREVWRSSTKNIGEWMIQNIKYKEIDSALIKLKKDIVSSAYRDSAKQLINLFNLDCSGWRRDSNNLKTVKGRVVLEMDYWREEYTSRPGKWASAVKWLTTVEDETGAKGLVLCISELLNADRRCHYSYKGLDLREKINEGGKVWCQIFKEKIKIHLDMEVFEALYGFLNEYANDLLGELTIDGK
ncbi:hypothetical protein A3715_18530 [Oleiphilus sp. HI0009]|nr:hypothetical protein A3715_18530 [Oleiphilus sp. HI0009]